MKRYAKTIRQLRSATAAVALLAVGACHPADLLNALVPNDGYKRTTDTAYGPLSRHRLDIYQPTASDHSGSSAIVVYVYGGSWKSGERGYYRFVGEALSSLGFVVVIPDYRLFPEVRFPAFVDDIALAIAWAREHAREIGGDPDRIVLVGHSAGAHIAALISVDRRYLDHAGVPPTAIRGLIGLAGPYAFDPLAYDSTRPIFTDAGDVPFRPVSAVGDRAPPALLLHGQDDDVVEPVNAMKFRDAILEAGGKAEAIVYPDVGHIGLVVSLSSPFRNRDRVFADAAEFLTRVAAADPAAAQVRTPDGDERPKR